MRDLEISFDVGGDQRADVVTTRVDEADDQWLTAERLQRKRLTGDVAKRVVTNRLADGSLADRQRGLAVIVLLRRGWRPYPEKDKGAEYRSRNGGCALCA